MDQSHAVKVMDFTYLELFQMVDLEGRTLKSRLHHRKLHLSRRLFARKNEKRCRTVCGRPRSLVHDLRTTWVQSRGKDGVATFFSVPECLGSLDAGVARAADLKCKAP